MLTLPCVGQSTSTALLKNRY